MNNFRWALTALCLLLLNNAGAQTKTKAGQNPTANPEKSFLNPPPAAKPGVLWMWMGANVSKAGIRKDLEALKKEGFNRTTMFSLADVTTPWAGSIGNSPTPEIISWTEPWWKMVRYAAEESKRLGMDFGMYNGPGYESSGGPWVTPEQSMQEVCWSATPVSGNTHVAIKLSRANVKLRGHTPWPIHNPKTGIAEIPDVPARQTYYKDITVLAMPEKGTVLTSQVIDLSKNMQPDGSLSWDAPAGNWIIYRFGHTTSGTMIQPAQWQATGLECDKISQQAIDFHLDHVIGEIQKHIGDLIGTGFNHLHFDSYEAGTPTWTPLMPQEFLKRRGYSVMPYLATFAGRVVCDDKSDSLKFVRDFDATVKDLYRDIYFKTIAKKVHAAKLQFLCEPYGGPWRQDEIMPLVDKVMTEFWTHGGKYSPYELETTVQALRKSGQNIVEAEAFTGDPRDSKWDETPAWIKPMGDAAFCEGVNRLILHRFVQQPWDAKYLPGLTMGQWGTHFDRTQTWWEPGKALVDYWQRCQALLQWGRIAKADKDDVTITGAQAGSVLKNIHRTDGKTDIYFVANTAHQPITASCTFKIAGMQPELWDPVTKTMRNLPNFNSDMGRTSITINFDDAQSFFIVFRKKSVTPVASAANFPTKKTLQTLGGSWSVGFDDKWGGPAQPVTFTALEDWTKRSEPGIKYYSGTAAYTKTFDLADVAAKEKANTYYLDLGEVKHLARVKVNNTDLGVVWTAPWGVSIPAGILKSKNNKLTIEVTNVWANRLIGDEQEPADCEWLHGQWGGDYLKEFPDWFLKNEQRPSKGRYCFTTWNYFTKDSPLISSGLIGPVSLKKE
ncbi:glycosyl hydrolase [Mucilaginibacter sp.]|uniref:glycosyl hydrolase n=1 Tax=Mucilaginibacter sp. TaxID=1882438 RepID=UPI0032667DA9